MTNYNERLDDILSKTPCVQCDGSGAYPDCDGEPVQCQFCWQLRFTFIDKAKQAITSLFKELVDEQVVQALKELKEEKKVVDVFASFGITKRIEAVPVKAIDNKIKVLEEV